MDFLLWTALCYVPKHPCCYRYAFSFSILGAWQTCIFLCGMLLQIGVEFKQHIISQWRNSFGLVQGKETKLLWWKNMWLAALWTIWNTRNNLFFNDYPVDLKKAMELIKVRSWKWNIAKLKHFKCSMYHWISNIKVIMKQEP